MYPPSELLVFELLKLQKLSVSLVIHAPRRPRKTDLKVDEEMSPKVGFISWPHVDTTTPLSFACLSIFVAGAFLSVGRKRAVHFQCFR